MSAVTRNAKREVIRANDYAAYRATAYARSLAKRPVATGGHVVPDNPTALAHGAAVQAAPHGREVAPA